VPCHFVEVGVVVPDSAWHCARRGLAMVPGKRGRRC
jgi:hypothetical protein